MMKRILLLIAVVFTAVTSLASSQGWPANYGGVMLQGFYWNYINDNDCAWNTWGKVSGQANDMKGYFDLIWIPQSSRASSNPSMGYDPMYFFNLDTNFGNKGALKNMITTLKSKNIKVIGDVVINHHGTNNGWFGFPKETYNGVTYQLLPSDVCKDDDGGKAAEEVKKLGVQLSNNKDEGEDWSGMRDLDHNSANVQNVVNAYENMLVYDLGYAGFRYDMVKGFNGSHIRDYNNTAGVEFSVGEHWSGNEDIKNWINSTDAKSAAFDFQFRYNVRDAINSQNWAALNSTNNLMHDSYYRRYAVTFVENHDTERRPDAEQDPIKADTLAANAYLLAMPGTPCVFLKHWIDYKEAIKAMINVRKDCGINNQTNYEFKKTSNSYVAIMVHGTNKTLLAIIGNEGNYNPNNDANINSTKWVRVLSGKHFAYYLQQGSGDNVFIDLVSGTYKTDQKATLTTTSADAHAKIAYTLDGTEPTAANGTQVTSGSKINIPVKSNGANITLKTVLVIDGEVIGDVMTRKYLLDTFEPYTIKVYVDASGAGTAWAAARPTATSPYINYWTWGGDNSHSPANKNWPGDKVTTTEQYKNITCFVKTFTINSSNDAVNFVFSLGTGSPQTVDVMNINKTTYIKILTGLTNGKYNIRTEEVATGIEHAENSVKEIKNNDPYYYTLNGMRVIKPTQKGIYIHQGKKIVLR
jgi:alpha-amylase